MPQSQLNFLNLRKKIENEILLQIMDKFQQIKKEVAPYGCRVIKEINLQYFSLIIIYEK